MSCALIWAVALSSAVPVPDEENQQTASEWLLAEQMHTGQLVHERVEAVDELSLLQVGLAARPRVTQTAYFDVSIGGAHAGRIRLGLFGEVTPRTVANFAGLARGGGERNGQPLHYKGSRLHRIMPGFMIQGGDFTRGDGTGGDSLEGGTLAAANPRPPPWPRAPLPPATHARTLGPALASTVGHRQSPHPSPEPGTFADENFHLKHSEAGRLSMANYGTDTNKARPLHPPSVEELNIRLPH